ncbi:glycosyltransferase N-terminal domain-containing protein [Alkalilimnicola ehrlichii]|uniref:3-deoxy-D-manno-octulosonic acid transferase n=1 Tax=Alkalilimnicola ehrlichii TaxID=351052 RepID=UPI001C6E0C28
MHAVSVGEVEAVAPLVRRLQADHPDIPILLTTTTPTGFDRVRSLFGDRVRHTYLPYDLPPVVGRFFRRTQPRLGIIMETELWPNLLAGAARRNVPMCLVNARLSERSVRRYRRYLARLMSPAVRSLCLVAAQSAEDAAHLQTLGARPEVVHVVGNLKFDLQLPAEISADAAALRSQLAGSRPVWIAASTHQGEEEVLLSIFARLRRIHPRLLLVLVPRHPERFRRVERLCESNGLATVCLSQGLHSTTDADVFWSMQWVN